MVGFKLYLIKSLGHGEEEFDSNEWSLEFLFGWLTDSSQDYSAAAEVLILDQFIGIGLFSLRQAFEELRETSERHIVAIEVNRLNNIKTTKSNQSAV